MANSKSRKFNMSRPGSDIGVYVTNFLPGTEMPKAIDQTILHCPTDGGCKWSESCETGDLVCVNGIWYYTWKFKGLKDDWCPNNEDIGLHLHLSCNEDQTGIRITASDLFTIMQGLKKPEAVNELCTWILDNCLDRDAFIDAVCIAVSDECFADDDFSKALCEWFANQILTKDIFIDSFSNWIEEIVFSDPGVIDSICSSFAECLTDSSSVIETIKDIIKNCLVNDSIENIIKNQFLDCFDSDEIKNKLCEIFNGCVTACSWNSESDSDPTGEAADCWYLIDEISGCVTHIAIDGVWVCIGVTEDEEPPPPDVEITGSKYGPSYSDFSPFTPVCDPSGATGTMTAPNISTSSDGFCDDDVQAGTYPSMQEQLNEYHTIVVSNATQNLEVCFDIEGGGGNTIDVFLLDSSNTALPFASASGGNNAAISSSFQCGHQGASFSIAPFAQPQTTTANMCFVINSVPPGTYTFVINAIRGLAPRCTRNFTVTSI